MGGSLQPNDNLGSLSVRKLVIPMEHFLNDDWLQADLLFDGGAELKALPVKLDVLNSYVLVRSDDGEEKVLPFSRLDSAYIRMGNGTKRLFVTDIPRVDSSLPIEGFFEIVKNKNNAHALVIQYEAEVVEPNQKVAMSVSRKETTTRLDTDHFVLYNDQLYSVPRSKKKFVKQFNSQDQAMVLQLLKSLKTNLKDSSSLLVFVQNLE